MKIHPHILTWFLLQNLIYQSNQKLSPQFTLTAIIRLFTVNLILKSFTHHLRQVTFGTIKIQMLILSDDPLTNLTGTQPFQINMKTKKFWFSIKLFLNTLSNIIPHEVIVCDHKDPPWFNRKIKSLTNEKLRTHYAYHENICNNNIIVNYAKSWVLHNSSWAIWLMIQSKDTSQGYHKT